MMRKWCNIMPVFFVRWYAKKHGERYNVAGAGICVTPFDDVLIVVERQEAPHK